MYLYFEFIKYATVYVIEDFHNYGRGKYYILRKLSKIFPIYKIKNEERLFLNLKNINYSFIYANTVVSLKWIEYIKLYIKAPIILHVHEQQMSIDKFFR